MAKTYSEPCGCMVTFLADPSKGRGGTKHRFQVEPGCKTHYAATDASAQARNEFIERGKKSLGIKIFVAKDIDIRF